MWRCFDEDYVPSFNSTLDPEVPHTIRVTLFFAVIANHLFPGRAQVLLDP